MPVKKARKLGPDSRRKSKYINRHQTDEKSVKDSNYGTKENAARAFGCKKKIQNWYVGSNACGSFHDELDDSFATNATIPLQKQIWAVLLLALRGFCWYREIRFA